MREPAGARPILGSSVCFQRTARSLPGRQLRSKCREGPSQNYLLGGALWQRSLSIHQAARTWPLCLVSGNCVANTDNAVEGKIYITSAQLSMLLEGIDWRRPERTWRPRRAG